MAKVTVRVAMHRNHPDKFVDLMKEIIAQHESLGASSQLHDTPQVDMGSFKAKLIEAETLRNESKTARALAESKMNQAKAILGTNPGQTINTDGTLYYELDLIKKHLLNKNRGNYESLSEYGFDVVIGTAKGIGRPRKKKD